MNPRIRRVLKSRLLRCAIWAAGVVACFIAQLNLSGSIRLMLFVPLFLAGAMFGKALVSRRIGIGPWQSSGNGSRAFMALGLIAAVFVLLITPTSWRDLWHTDVPSMLHDPRPGVIAVLGYDADAWVLVCVPLLALLLAALLISNWQRRRIGRANSAAANPTPGHQ